MCRHGKLTDFILLQEPELARKQLIPNSGHVEVLNLLAKAKGGNTLIRVFSCVFSMFNK